MQAMSNMGINQRVLLLTVAPAIVIAVLLAGYLTITRIQDLDQALLERGEAIVRQLAPASEHGVFLGNKDFLFAIANAVIEERDVRSVSISDSNGRMLARSGPSFRRYDSPLPWLTGRGTSTVEPSQQPPLAHDPVTVTSRDGLSLLIYGPIYQSEVIVDDLGAFEDLGDPSTGRTPKHIGWVGLELSRASTLLKKDRVLRNSLLITISVLLISVLVGARLVRRVTAPIIELTGAVQRLENGELDTHVEVDSDGELGTLQKGINAMATTMQSARDDLQEQIDLATLELRETLDTVELQNAQLAISKKEALAASEVKSEFLANMSHEIRTPLNGILGYTNLLLKTALGEEQHEHAMTIKNSGEALLYIVNDILDFSKIESGQLELESVDINLLDCVEEVLDVMAPDAHEKGLELVYVLYSDVPPLVRGDPVRLRQVLANLVSNAVKFTSAGSVVVRIMREDETTGHIVLRFAVSDTGAGLSEPSQRRLFRAFSQADSTATRKFGGTGLGLVISKKLVERMHGQITLESELGKGTTVTFTVRCEKSDAAAAYSAGPRLQGVRALLYDAHPIMRLALLEDLSRWGVHVVDANDITRLTEILSGDASYDVAILGLSVDDRNIQQDRELVRLVGSRCGCAILVLASATTQSRLGHLSGMGISAFLSKPVHCEKLRHELETLVTGQPRPAPAPKIAPQHGGKASRLDAVRVLVAEDNEVSRRLAAYLLENQGAEVTVAVNGRQALEHISGQDFDLVLMDVHMPEIDGATVTSMVRAAERGIRHTPVVALTADALEGNRERFLEAGMDDYLSKPIDEESLYTVVERWVGARGRNGVRSKSAGNSALPVVQEGPAVLDKAQALKVTGGRTDLAGELLGMLLKDLEAYRDKLQRALAEEKLETIAELAHTLAGGAAHCGALALNASAKALEDSAINGHSGQVPVHLDQMYREMERLSKSVESAQV